MVCDHESPPRPCTRGRGVFFSPRPCETAEKVLSESPRGRACKGDCMDIRSLKGGFVPPWEAYSLSDRRLSAVLPPLLVHSRQLSAHRPLGCWRDKQQTYDPFQVDHQPAQQTLEQHT